jgi:hypothetical protein
MVADPLGMRLGRETHCGGRCQTKILYYLVPHPGGLGLHCFCSQISPALDPIQCQKLTILICLDNARKSTAADVLAATRKDR